MKLKKVILICSIIGLHVVAYGQELTIGKGTSMISGKASFSNTGYSSANATGSTSFTELTLSPSGDYFIVDHLFVGAGLSYLGTNTNGFKTTKLGIGPEIGYAFGNQDSKLFPYINAGWNYLKSTMDFSYFGTNATNNSSANGISFGIGVIVPVKTHIGLVLEGKYNNFNYSNSNEIDNVISVNFGIVGLLF
ncbi:MAG: outer membrane beta-barrel protein [Paludibacter sp.]|nr:outer membrane beta-barrel protein [Paludibacter sp.]